MEATEGTEATKVATLYKKEYAPGSSVLFVPSVASMASVSNA